MICHGVHFLLDPKVLYEICTFGLQEDKNEVPYLVAVFISWLACKVGVDILHGGLRLMWHFDYVMSSIQKKSYANSEVVVKGKIFLFYDQFGDSVLSKGYC